MNVEAVVASLSQFEGMIPWMYRDTGGLVTAGIGHALPTADDAVDLPWALNDSPATAEEVRSCWKAVLIKQPGLPAGDYRSVTEIRLPSQCILDLCKKQVEELAVALQKEFPKWSAFPESAQLALVDMAFNLGMEGLIGKFPQMTQAVEDEDWYRAALECYRKGIQWSRNVKTRGLFLNAADA